MLLVNRLQRFSPLQSGWHQVASTRLIILLHGFAALFGVFHGWGYGLALYIRVFLLRDEMAVSILIPNANSGNAAGMGTGVKVKFMGIRRIPPSTAGSDKVAELTML